MTDSEHTYAYSRSPMSAPWEFALAPDVQYAPPPSYS